MIIWINGAFGSGKTTTAFELRRRLPDSFVYDPENVGYFIRRNAPPEFSKGDFQDIPLWREMNYRHIKLIASEYTGTIIIPMTLVNPAYYDEIIGRLRADGLDIRHFILYAGKAEILRRLRQRSLWIFGVDEFAAGSVDRCLHAFDNVITDEKIDTEHIGAEAVVDEIARRCGLVLQPDKKTRPGRWLHRVGVWLRHVR
jgi:Adenylylsulfate kinase and related kinases